MAPKQLTSEDFSILRKMVACATDLPADMVDKQEEYHRLMLQWSVEMSGREERIAEEEARRSQASPMEAPQWIGVQRGTLVKRSKHYLKQQTYQRPGMPPLAEQVGIVTKVEMYKDDLCGLIGYPEIHWQGESFSATSHPMNACLADGQALKLVTMNANQLSEK